MNLDTIPTKCIDQIHSFNHYPNQHPNLLKSQKSLPNPPIFSPQNHSKFKNLQSQSSIFSNCQRVVYFSYIIYIHNNSNRRTNNTRELRVSSLFFHQCKQSTYTSTSSGTTPPFFLSKPYTQLPLSISSHSTPSYTLPTPKPPLVPTPTLLHPYLSLSPHIHH